MEIEDETVCQYEFLKPKDRVELGDVFLPISRHKVVRTVSRVGFMGGGAHPQGRGTGGGRIALGEYTPPNARLPGCTGC